MLTGQGAPRADPAAFRMSDARTLALSVEHRATLEFAMDGILPSTDGIGARTAGAIEYVDWLIEQPLAVELMPSLTAGLDTLESLALAIHGRRFAHCSLDERTWVLNVTSQLPLEATRRFFLALLRLTVAGFLCPPEYGGNRCGSGWRFVGFELQPIFTAATDA